MKRLLVSLVAATALTGPSALRAQSGAVARGAAELVESLARRGGAEASEKAAAELAGFGGTRAVAEVLEQAEREGGEALVRSVTLQAERHGVLALTALKGAPAGVIRAVDSLPADLAENGLRALAREPQAMSRLVTEFGPAALETAARHPGLAAKLAPLGDDGFALARSLGTDDALRLARHADDLAKLPPAERSAVMNLLREAPAKTLSWIEKHPRLLIAGSATAAVVAARREIFGDGTQPGFLERAAAAFHNTFRRPVDLVVGGLAAAILGWAGIRLWGTWRRVRRRTS